MKKGMIILISSMLISCGVKSTVEKESETSQKTENIKEKSFDELFKSISPKEITDNVFKLVGKDFTVITAGKIPEHNSMTASWGGLGILFGKPTTWCFLRASRYTLELIKKEQTYTMSYFPDEYKEQVLFFGSKTGKNTDKMKETTLTAIQTPSGNTTYKEARLIIECKLAEITTVSPEDFYTSDGKTFVEEAYEEVKEYHKMVFGEITNVWINNK